MKMISKMSGILSFYSFYGFSLFSNGGNKESNEHQQLEEKKANSKSAFKSTPMPPASLTLLQPSQNMGAVNKLNAHVCMAIKGVEDLNRNHSLVEGEFEQFVEKHDYNRVELLGILIKYKREEEDMSRAELAKKAYLSIEVVMALELGIYDEDEIEFEWLDRISTVLSLHLEYMASILGQNGIEIDDASASETHLDFYSNEVFQKAQSRYENGELEVYQPHQFLIDQLSQCGREDEQAQLAQIWLKEQAENEEYVGKTLIKLAISSLPTKETNKTKNRLLESVPVPAQAESICISAAAFDDPYKLLCDWVSYHPGFRETLMTIIKYNKDMDIPIGEMLLGWSRNSLRIESNTERAD